MKVYLTGARLGQTFTYQHRHVFVDGMTEIENNYVNLLTFLRRSLQVRTEYEPRLEDGPGDIQDVGEDETGVSDSDSVLPHEIDATVASVPSGDGATDVSVEGNPQGNIPNGVGQPNSVESEGRRLRDYIMTLDCAKDENWRSDGTVKVAAVSDIFPRITSAQIATIAGDLSRGNVRRLKSMKRK